MSQREPAQALEQPCGRSWWSLRLGLARKDEPQQVPWVPRRFVHWQPEEQRPDALRRLADQWPKDAARLGPEPKDAESVRQLAVPVQPVLRQAVQAEPVGVQAWVGT